MRVAFDIECNALVKPTEIWVCVCKDIDTGEYHEFRNLVADPVSKENFLLFSKSISLWVGHNVLDYDLPILHDLVGLTVPTDLVLDTLVLSRLVDYPRDGHSIESYGVEFNLPKGEFDDFSKLTEEMVTYCRRDVDICHLIYDKYSSVVRSSKWQPAIRLEHDFAVVCHDMGRTGFAFNVAAATKLVERVKKEIEELDHEIRTFPPRFKFIREVCPKPTKWGTINQTSIPVSLRSRIHEFSVGSCFSYGEWVTYNPDSIKQTVDILWDAGWKPEDKTKGHIEALREAAPEKIEKFARYGWKVNETNLSTLPLRAPAAAKSLARRILCEARRRTLSEWLSLVNPDDERIHGRFSSIGAWTHRMAHQAPNMANIPNSTDISGRPKFLGGEMRSLFVSPRERLLVGVDAAAIQLRIFAHYIDDAEFTQALVEGKKEDKSDPHSLNQRILGKVCKSRAAAKRFIFALLLGAGLGKLSEILECGRDPCKHALDRLLERYTGFALLKQTIIPADGRRGFFIGLDGRKVRIPGDTAKDRAHLAMSGYLQCGEAIVMKMATIRWQKKLLSAGVFPPSWNLVNLVHDEWQTETANDPELALLIANIQSESLREVGEELKLKCPLIGSFLNDDGKPTIGINWKLTH